MSKTAEEYSKEFDAMYGDHTPDLPVSKAEEIMTQKEIQREIDKKKGKSYYVALMELMNMIEPPRWISVNEKLPPEDEEVIVLTNEANGHTLPIACHLCFAHIVSDKTMFVDYDGWNIPQVKYWMPCPELPEK